MTNSTLTTYHCYIYICISIENYHFQISYSRIITIIQYGTIGNVNRSISLQFTTTFNYSIMCTCVINFNLWACSLIQEQNIGHDVERQGGEGAANQGANQENLEKWLPISASRKAKWWYSTFHNVTAMVGAGVLGLPFALSQLGWYLYLNSFNFITSNSSLPLSRSLTRHQ